MKTNVSQITFHFIYSLMLHTVIITLLLLLSPPLYRISSDFPFISVRVYSSSFFSGSSKFQSNKTLKNAISNKSLIRQDIYRRSSLENKEGLENKKAHEEVEGHKITQQLEQLVNVQKDPEKSTASVTNKAIIEGRKNEFLQDADTAGLITTIAELKKELLAETKLDINEKAELKIKDPIKTTRIQQDDAPMTEKAIDSLFDNEGIDNIENKHVKPVEKKNEKIYLQPHASLQKTNSEIKAKGTEKEVARSGKHEENKQLKQKNLDSKSIIIEKVKVDAEGHVGQAGTDSAINMPSSFIPQQNMAQTIEDSLIDKIFESQNKEMLTDLAEKKGNILIEPYGDLKLEIKVEEGLINNIQTTVKYREFLKKQRNKTQKKSEVKYIRVEPKIINRGDNITTLIVETAGEGIYNFIIESNNKPFKASFVVKLYEKSSKEKSKTLGNMAVNDKITIKILMPEGIFWDDDSYFSGYMEDSESITKFNIDTGLVWKEYKE